MCASGPRIDTANTWVTVLVLLIVDNATLKQEFKSPLYGLTALPIKLIALPIKQSS